MCYILSKSEADSAALTTECKYITSLLTHHKYNHVLPNHMEPKELTHRLQNINIERRDNSPVKKWGREIQFWKIHYIILQMELHAE